MTITLEKAKLENANALNDTSSAEKQVRKEEQFSLKQEKKRKEKHRGH